MVDQKIVLVALDCETAETMYHALSADFHISQVILEKKENRWTFLRRRWKRQGAIVVLGQILFQLIVPRILRGFSQNRIRVIKDKYGLKDGPIPEDRILRVNSVNEAATTEALLNLDPDIIVLHGTRIVSKNTLNAVKCPWVNVHAGITPNYRGSHGGYWALYHGRPQECGVTVHLVDPGIDTGNILAQGTIEPQGDNITTYPWLQLGLGILLLKTELRKLLACEIRTLADPLSKGALYYNPTLLQYLRGLLRGVF